MTDYKIYVRCLSAYNNGILHGAWINASSDHEEMLDGVRKVLATSPMEDAEEWAIHDYEGFTGSLIGEYTSFEKIAELVEFLEEHEDYALDLIENFHGDVEEAKAAAEEYAGEYPDLGYFAEELSGTTRDIPEQFVNYIDWDAMGRDMELNGDVFTIDNGGSVHVFWNR